MQDFLNRKGLYLRRKTTVAQNTASNAAEKIANFLHYYRNLSKQYQFESPAVIAMDETAVWMGMPGNTTIDEVGVRTVAIGSTEHDKARITCVLAASTDGYKFPPFLVFKGKRKPKELKGLKGIHLRGKIKVGWTR